MASTKSCGCGPGYSSPLEAMKGPKEQLLYVICVQPDYSNHKTDYLATIDVNPDSPSYGKVVHRTYGLHPGDEFHHFGWNACSSCHGSSAHKRDKIVIPCLNSDRVYILDTSDPVKPTIFKVLEPEEMHKFGVSTPHTAHCLASGEVMISVLGDPMGNPLGEFILLDATTWTYKGLWTQSGTPRAKFGYDFWYQPYHDVMISSEWGAPKGFKKGFNPAEMTDDGLWLRGNYLTGNSLNFYSWSQRKLIQTIDLELPNGITPLEVRFLHNPKEAQGYVGTAVGSTIFRFYKKEDGSWGAQEVIKIPEVKVQGWVLPEVSGLVSDVLISLDDRFLYFSNWGQGDVRQYDITDREHPKLVGRIFLGGLLTTDRPVKVLDSNEIQPPPRIIRGVKVEGGPQMLQLSLDGKRLYVTTSLFSPWDRQIYPEMVKKGSVLMRLNVDTDKGGLSLDETLFVNFGDEPNGPVLAHECRYPGGDCTSDIWLA